MNNTETILPVTFPIVTSFPSIASLFSILSNYKQTEDWIYNNFINLWGFQYGQDEIVLRFSPERIRKICPFISYNRFHRDFLDAYSNDIEHFLISCISLGYYVLLQYDEFYIPHAINYQKRHTYHQMFIYGFDKRKSIFYIGDFFRSRKYSYEEASFSDVVKSVNSIPPNDKDFFAEIFKFENADYRFDIDMFIKDINDFLNSKRTILSYEDSCLTDYEKSNIYYGTMRFGMSNYDLIIDNLSSLITHNRSFLSIRSFHVLSDHKALMLNRLNFLKERELIKNIEYISSKFKTIYELCLINRGLFIKYSLTSKSSTIENIIKNLEIIKLEERATMLQLLDEISANLKIVRKL